MVVQGNNEVSPFDGGVSVMLIVPQMRFDFNGRVLRQRAVEMKKTGTEPPGASVPVLGLQREYISFQNSQSEYHLA